MRVPLHFPFYITHFCIFDLSYSFFYWTLMFSFFSVSFSVKNWLHFCIQKKNEILDALAVI